AVAELVADEMTLDQNLTVERAQLRHAQQEAVAERLRVRGRVRDAHQDALELLVARAVRERHVTQVPRQTNPRGDDELGVGTRPREPRARRLHEGLEIAGRCAHACPPLAVSPVAASFSIRLIASRISAARSNSSFSIATWSSS